MNTNIVFGQYHNSDSIIHRLDPRTKILGLFILIIGLFFLTDIYSLLIAFSVVVLIILLTKIPLSKFLRSLKMMTTLLFITVIFQVLFNQGNDFKTIAFHMNILNLGIVVVLWVLFFLSKKVIRKFRLILFAGTLVLSFYLQTLDLPTEVFWNYSLKFYEKGLEASVVVILRIISLLFLSSTLTLTTKPTDLNYGLEKLASPLKWIGVKVSILTMMISIALRFIPTLVNEANKILKAQASRGVDFKEAKFKDKINQIISLLIPMFVISYKRAYDLADAMEARGYIPEGNRTTINILKFRFSDYVAFVSSVLLAFVAIYYKVAIF